MTPLRRLCLRLTAIPSTNEALIAAAVCPMLFAVCCRSTPQLAEYLNGLGLHVTMWMLFLQGLGVYIFLLGKHQTLGGWYRNRHADQIERHRQLTATHQCMIVAGLADTPEFHQVASEREFLRVRLGHFLEPLVFYHKLGKLGRVMKQIHRLLERIGGKS
ncbi:hypothetical protein EXN22_14150 [Pseudomonas tructae]|uniref:Uncharacterized protein n=1 Tax=Pseudomonas tructae TaxID=2518644 RepID=A0A411MJ15_9PSED|nr:hypothetical protein [Pseudomonas tructae]QBF26778.1 hypothetical protein EXN22_14150 [Pseudomonas tructae]